MKLVRARELIKCTAAARLPVSTALAHTRYAKRQRQITTRAISTSKNPIAARYS
jgi:hypothetical protein